MRGLLFAFLIFLFWSCTRERFTSNPDARLSLSADTLHFDTVLTSTGSVTQVVKLINDNKDGIRINSISLGGGASSPFRINVDGQPGPQVNDLQIAGGDSLYIFVALTITPTSVNDAFLVRDSIRVRFNGREQLIQLDAFGQNANFYRNRVITGNEVWNSDKPHVILGRLTIDTTARLTIEAGTRIYVHADAPMIVHGSLQVNGGVADADRVIFTGDRLDEPYRSYPASYPGLIFSSASRNNSISYAVIKNAYQGIVISGPSAGTQLSLRETVIDNAFDAGLLAVNSNITAQNVLISNCGRNLLLARGGTYDFNHCTAVAYSNNFIQHREPVLTITNYAVEGGTIATAPLNARFHNSIFWGEAGGVVADEVVALRQGGQPFNLEFNAVLWRLSTPPTPATITGALQTTAPRFDSVNTFQRFYSFRLKDDSPALNKGFATSNTIDLDGKPRPVGLPDLGAYEKQ